MLLSDFTYPLDEKHIAKFPPLVRGESNLLVIDTNGLNETNFKEHLKIDKYHNLYKHLDSKDLVILNNTKVIPARILGKNIRGANIEILLLENHNDKNFLTNAIIRGNIKEWESLYIGKKKVLKIVEKNGEFGKVRILMKWNDLTKLAQMPLPPYIDRLNETLDKERYQTIFGQKEGSVAAPTASLNVTPELIENLKLKNIVVEYLTLHCGYGTFNAIKSETIEDHKMHSEYFEIDELLWNNVLEQKKANKSIVGIGTTVTRTLEFLCANSPHPFGYHEARLGCSTRDDLGRGGSSLHGEANIFLYPGKRFQIIDKLVTNFHAPNSTPLMLTLAFFIHKLTKNTDEITIDDIQKWKSVFFEIYKFAMENNFKLLSYGDSMLII